jgi:hypothetical protein
MCDYAKIVSAAEAAVTNLADEKLKVIAFTEILKHQLHSTHQEEEAPTRKSHASAKTEASTNSGTQAKTREGLPAWLLEMKGDDFFKTPRSQRAVHTELQNRSHHIPMTSLPGALGALVRRRELRRTKSNDEDGKSRWHWSYW